MLLLKDHDKLALAYDGREYSYFDLINVAGVFADSLRDYVKEQNTAGAVGSRIGICFENRPEWAFACYGATLAGGVTVPVDYMSTPHEIAYIVDDCKPVVLFCSDKTCALVEESVRLATHKPAVLNVDVMSTDGTPSVTYSMKVDDESLAVLIYTSGTTGSPKGVMLSWGNIGSIVEVLATDKYDANDIMFAPDETYIAILPFHHIYPLQGTLLGPLAAGSAVCMIKEISADSIFATCQKYQVTRMLGVPRLYTMFHRGIMSKVNASAIGRTLFRISRRMNCLTFSKKVFGKVQKTFGGNIRALMCGGSKLDIEIARDFAALGFRVLEGYGMTETAPSMTMCNLKRFKHGSVGYVVPCGQVKLVEGEFCYKGPNVMKGYYNRPEETAAMFDAEGWLHTGDRAEIDTDGFVRITGRLKEIIVLSNGKNVNPEEIENTLIADFPYIKDVGVLDHDNMLYAVILPDFARMKEHNIVNIRETLRWEVIDRYNVKAAHHLKILGFEVTEQELPRTRVGKLKRFELKNMVGQQRVEKKTVALPDYEEYSVLVDIFRDMVDREVHPEDHLELDLNMDSLDRVGLQVRIENCFGIKMSNEDLSRYPLVRDLADYIHHTRTKIVSEKTDWGTILKQKIDFRVPRSFYMMRLLLILSWPSLKFYFRVRAEGLENVPTDTPVIFAPNHQSHLDGLMLSSMLRGSVRRRTFFFAKDRNFKSWIARFFAKRANVVLMNINRDLKDTLQRMAAISAGGNNIAIFPEGARSRDGQLQSFKKTFAILSSELNLPVVPVVIDGTFSIFKIGSKIPRPGKVAVRFLEPVMPGEMSYEEITDKTHDSIENSMKK